MLKIGSINLDVPFLQAPLSGYSDYAMRKLALDFGAPFTFAGVMLAKSAVNPRVLCKKVFQPQPDEHPIGAQLLGNDPAVMADAAKKLTEAGYDLIDLNFACPAPKVLRRKLGGYLINEPARAIEIYQAVREAVDCPVTVKLRSSYKKTDICRDNFWKICEALSKGGVDALVVHGRSVMQRYRKTADWQIPSELKKAFPETVIIGSGDLLEAQRAFELMKTSGVDGLLIARGAIGNPWIYRELRALFEGKDKPPVPSLQEQGEVILKHLELVSGIYKKSKAVRFLRKFLVNYCKLHPERKKAQASLLAANDHNQLYEAIEKWYGVSGPRLNL